MRHAAALAALLATFLTLPARAQIHIALRTSARADGHPLRIAHVARVTGPEADSIAQAPLPVPPDADHVSLDDLRSALRAARPDLDWGTTTLSGGRCLLARPSDDTPPTTRRTDAPEPVPADSLAPGTVAHAIARRLAHALNTTTDNLRLSIDWRGPDLSDRPTDGATVEIDLSGTGPRMGARVRIFHGDALADAAWATITAQVRRTVAVATRDIPRGSTITDDDFAREDRFVDPGSRLADPLQIAGALAATAIGAGEPITPADLRRPWAVQRGDTVIVHCFVGSLHAQVRARALDSARAGQTVPCQTLEPDRNARRTLRARIVGPGRAVLSTTDEPHTTGAPSP